MEAFQLLSGELFAAPVNVITAPGRSIGRALINQVAKDDPEFRTRMLEVVDQWRLDGRDVTIFFDRHVGAPVGGWLYDTVGIFNPEKKVFGIF